MAVLPTGFGKTTFIYESFVLLRIRVTIAIDCEKALSSPRLRGHECVTMRATHATRAGSLDPR